MKRIIVVDLAGALGNHIFLFEMANFISSIDNSVILVNKTEIDRKHSSGKSTIEDFSFPSRIYFFTLSPIINILYFRLKHFLKNFNYCKLLPTLVLDEKYNSNSRIEVLNLICKQNPKFIIISGYWQNFAYWNNGVNYKLKSEGIQFKKFSNEIDIINPIIFHYRLGKFNNGWEHSWGALSPQYLADALDTLKFDNSKSKTVWVFSNDMLEAKRLIGSVDIPLYQIVFIDDLALLPSELMMLFSKAEVLICSNSTFSIVAAKIGNVRNVIVPSELSKNYKTSLEFPFEWKRVPSVWLE
jgi:hypothetical protein